MTAAALTERRYSRTDRLRALNDDCLRHAFRVASPPNMSNRAVTPGPSLEPSEVGELSATSEQLRTIVEHAPEAIAVFDAEQGRFVHGNENASKLFGLTRPHLLQTSMLALSLELQADGQPSPPLL